MLRVRYCSRAACSAAFDRLNSRSSNIINSSSVRSSRSSSATMCTLRQHQGWPLHRWQQPLHGRRSAATTSRIVVAAAASGKSGSSSSSGSTSELQRSIRAMPIRIVRVSKDTSTAQAAAAQEWLEKLRRYTSVTEVLVRPNPKNASSPAVQKQAEAEKVLKAVGAGERLILLDERGRDASSEDMARLLLRASDDGVGLAFCIGGPFGHGAAVVERADNSIRLSRMVLNHSVAHIVLVEQLYRAWTIVRGEPYHH